MLKQKYTTKSLKDKAKDLLDLQKGLSNKEVSKKYDVPKNTLSTWVKNKENVLAKQLKLKPSLMMTIRFKISKMT